MDLVRYHIETSKRDVLLSAEKLVPTGQNKALSIHGYEWSPGEKASSSTPFAKGMAIQHSRRLLGAQSRN